MAIAAVSDRSQFGSLIDCFAIRVDCGSAEIGAMAGRHVSAKPNRIASIPTVSRISNIIATHPTAKLQGNN
jgi:hypothetical protein